jgi:hypothetical protein
VVLLLLLLPLQPAVVGRAPTRVNSHSGQPTSDSMSLYAMQLLSVLLLPLPLAACTSMHRLQLQLLLLLSPLCR